MRIVSEPLPTAERLASAESIATAESGAIPDAIAAATNALRIRYRVRFGKEGLLRWISHRDLAMLWERLLRRAQFQLSMSEGFHPKPRIAFPSALALGIEGLDEVVEIELAEDLSSAEVLQRLQADRQPGLTIHRVDRLPEGYGKAQLLRSDFTISVPDAVDAHAVRDAIARLLSQSTVTIERKEQPLRVDIAEQVLRLEVVDAQICLSLAARDGASLRPIDVLALMGFDDWIEKGSQIRRVAVVLKKDLT
jgi:radical SAM-linked protein